MNDVLIDAVGAAAQRVLDCQDRAYSSAGIALADRREAMALYVIARARLDVAQIETRRAMQEDPGEGDKS